MSVVKKIILMFLAFLGIIILSCLGIVTWLLKLIGKICIYPADLLDQFLEEIIKNLERKNEIE